MLEYTRHKAENIEFMGMSSVGRCSLGVARGSLHVPGLIPSKTFCRYQNEVGSGVFDMLCDSWCLATSLFELVFVYAVFFWNDGATQQKKNESSDLLLRLRLRGGQRVADLRDAAVRRPNADLRGPGAGGRGGRQVLQCTSDAAKLTSKKLKCLGKI